ncbi:nucleotide sugar dehydrogenase [uncultured Dubosiella sp.]|uniref:nucleotide sugar dehydrogenase n=2 Tax=uncultured Dubosiella sp. TaxID=1937011 RepID=UPI002593B4FC|nr:nucleotide sugar dehydrogenase [uncultured Dubosiella sp.]
MKTEIIEKIKNKSVRVVVIGLGYVGEPLVKLCVEKGYNTIGIDCDQKVIDRISKNFVADHCVLTKDESWIAQGDIVLICVPTPLDEKKNPKVAYVMDACTMIRRHMHSSMTIVLESTVYPSMTESVLQPFFEETRYQCGQDFYLGFSPERIDPGNCTYHLANTTKLVSGIGEEALEIIQSFYQSILEVPVYPVSSPVVAELGKLLENTYRNVNIALIYEMSMLCERLHVSVRDVIDAAATKPYGYEPFYPSLGVGGHCIPVDPYYLVWKAERLGVSMPLIKNAFAINESRPLHILEQIENMLGDISLNRAEILLVGVGYKSDSMDTRESPALYLWDLLKQKGAQVSYFDPYISNVNGYCSVSSLDEISRYDLVVLCAPYEGLDIEWVKAHAQKVLDPRQ